MTYTDMLQKMDAKASYTNYNTKPVRRMNEVWEVIITTDKKVVREKIYKPTTIMAEKIANKYIENYIDAIKIKNANIKKKCEYENKKIRWDSLTEEEYNFWRISDETIDEMCTHIKSIIIKIIDKDGNERTIIK